MESKVEGLEDLNQAFRNRDKMKDDAIAQLSDQVMALTARMQENKKCKLQYFYFFSQAANFMTESAVVYFSFCQQTFENGNVRYVHSSHASLCLVSYLVRIRRVYIPSNYLFSVLFR